MILILAFSLSTYFWLREIPNKMSDLTVQIKYRDSPESIATGVIINRNQIITAKHAIPNDKIKIYAVTKDGKEYDVVKVHAFTNTDISVATLKENFPFKSFPKLSCNYPKYKGESFFTIGNSIGVYNWAYSEMYYSGNNRKQDKNKFFAYPIENVPGFYLSNSSAAPGNSGGGIFNKFGVMYGLASLLTFHDFQHSGYAERSGYLYSVALADVCDEMRKEKIKFRESWFF